jgi:hypothetical protein
LLLGLASQAQPLTPASKPTDFSQPRLNADLLYLGNARCGGACHGGEATLQSGQLIGDEKSIFDRDEPPGDPHAGAFETLTGNEKSKAIAAAAKIDAPEKAGRCLSCHAMDAPKSDPATYGTIADNAVGCESCHGPYQNAKGRHHQPGWMDGLRAQGASAVAEKGLIDTRDLAIRGETCVSCHLALDKDLIDAGHPELRFEMWWYNAYKERSADNPRTHWREPADKTHPAKVWAVGQIVAARAAKANQARWQSKGWETGKADAAAELYAAGLGIVKARFGEGDAAAFWAKYPAKTELPSGAVKAALGDLLALARRHQDGPDHAANRAVIGAGVEALVRATGGSPEKGAAKVKAGGEEWSKSLELLAGQAK